MTEIKPTTKLIKTEKNQALVEVTVPASLVAKHRQESLEHLAQTTTIKGFRQGKAPLDLVSQQLDPQKVTEHTLNHLIPGLVSAAIKDNQLKPIGSPHLSVKSVAPDADWSFELQIPLLPEIKLGDYQKTIAGVNASASIVVPGKETPKEQTEEARLNQIFDKLLETVTFDVPPVLVDEEVNQSLSRLLTQTQKLGLNIDDYLKTLGKEPDQLRQEYEKAATDNLRLELTLEAIAQELKVAVTDQEVQALINATATKESKDKLNTPREMEYIRAILRKRKTIDALLKL